MGNVGFGWSVDLQTDHFELMDKIFDISTVAMLPRPRTMQLILATIVYDPPCRPLHLLDRPASGVVKVRASPDSNRVVKIANHLGLQIFDSFVPPPGPNPFLMNLPNPESESGLGLSATYMRSAKSFMDVINTARRRA